MKVLGLILLLFVSHAFAAWENVGRVVSVTKSKTNGVILDIANVLRVLERHPDFAGRFRFSKGMGKICDRGKVLLGWQLDELTATIQERFLPAVPEAIIAKAVAIVAHRSADDRE